jgi:hypothetical protein
MTVEEREKLEKALDRLVGDRPGVRAALGPFLVACGLREADNILKE